MNEASFNGSNLLHTYVYIFFFFQIFSVRSRGATGIIVKGFTEQLSSTFRLEDKGPIISIKLSPDQKVLSVQRSKSCVEFFNVTQLGANGALDQKSYEQSSKSKASTIIGYEICDCNFYERTSIKDVRRILAFWTYLPMPDFFYTMPINFDRFLLRYLPTPKQDVLYGRSLRLNDFCRLLFANYLLTASNIQLL